MSELNYNKLAFRLLPVEVILVAYLLMTGIFQVINYQNLYNLSIHLLIRAVILVCIFGLALWASQGNKYSIHGLRVFLPFATLPFLYSETDYMNNIFFTQDLDFLVSRWDQYLFGFQPSLVFSEKFDSAIFAELMYFGYFSYFVFCIGIPYYVYSRVDKQSGEKFVFIIITSFLVFYLFFTVYPVGGPQFYYSGQEPGVPDGYIFGDIIRLLQDYAEGPTAAFPSSHVCISIIILIGSIIYVPRMVKYILPVIIILLFSTVYIRAHYFIDTLVGALIAPGFFWVLSAIYESGDEELVVDVQG